MNQYINSLLLVIEIMANLIIFFYIVDRLRDRNKA